MVLDNALMFDENTAVASSFNSAKVIDLGLNGAVYEPLDIQVNLSVANASGKITSIKVQSAATQDFQPPVDEAQFFVPGSVVQTKPCVLAQFKSPIKPQNRYVRLVYAGATPTGGKVSAFITKGIAVPY